jgi:hypothetical protein
MNSSEELKKIIKTIRFNESKYNLPYESEDNIESIYDIYKAYCDENPRDQQTASLYNFHEMECSESDINKFTVLFFLGMYTKNMIPKKFAPDRSIVEICIIILYKTEIDKIKYKLVMEEVLKYTEYSTKSEEKIKTIVDILDEFNTYYLYNIADDNHFSYILDDTMNYINILQTQTVKFIKGDFPMCKMLHIKPLQLTTSDDILHIIKLDLQSTIHENMMYYTIKCVKKFHNVRDNSVDNIIKLVFNIIEKYYKLSEYPDFEVNDDIPYDAYVALTGVASARSIKMVTMIYFKHIPNIYRLIINKNNAHLFLKKIIRNTDPIIITKIQESFDFDKYNPNPNIGLVDDSVLEEVDGGKRTQKKSRKQSRKYNKKRRSNRSRKSL